MASSWKQCARHGCERGFVSRARIFCTTICETLAAKAAEPRTKRDAAIVRHLTQLRMIGQVAPVERGSRSTPILALLVPNATALDEINAVASHALTAGELQTALKRQGIFMDDAAALLDMRSGAKRARERRAKAQAVLRKKRVVTNADGSITVLA